MAGVPEDLLKSAKASLVGPGADEEELPDRPNEIYVLGLLFPHDTEPEVDDFDTPDSPSGRGDRSDSHGASGTGRGSDDAPEREHAVQHLPSSIGIRCRVAPGTNAISAEVRFATYERTASGWKRRPEKRTVSISGGGKEDMRNADGGELASLTWRTEDDNDASGGVILSVFLSNSMKKYSGIGPGSRDKKCEQILFQPSIRLKGKAGSFVDSGATADRRLLMPDEIPLEMLYRKQKVYARGYGCSADWDRDGASPAHVFTDLMPHYQSKWIEFGSESDDSLPSSIDMVDVHEAADQQDLYDMLKDIPEKYSRWLSAEESAARDIDNDDFRTALSDNVRQCNRIRARIVDGLELLRDPANRDVYDAFKVTNRVMLWQMSRYKWAGRRFKSGGGGGPPPDPLVRGINMWRPFQVAFLLMNLRGIADAASDAGRRDRETADLLWFPTGGGKTEAYMALAAFTMVLRRLRRSGGDDGAGVSIIMRYTLRLLTVQQFERAATLICALEHFRRRDPLTLGTEPFLIGLWVGASLTPNKPEHSASALGGSGGGDGGDRGWRTGSPSQLIFCPWCGSGMSHANYRVDRRKTGWTIARCLDQGCDFYSDDPLDDKRALPVLTVDFDIYRRCPSLIISTVDKFARLPWKPEASSLFGIVDRKCSRCGYLTTTSDHRESRHRESQGGGEATHVGRLAPPDLIIQDELHLITGPLGTMVGLYETAVDYLCSFEAADEKRPKIVASTATISGAEGQIHKLFDRKDVSIFPCPVARPDNMFFWWESRTDGRLYAGVSYSHRSAKFTMARLYAALLQRTGEIKSCSADATAVDPYWTLVGYFNSIRELGGATRLVEDDIRDNIRSLSERSSSSPRSLSDPVEITSRVTGQDIREVRRRLELGASSEESLDVLLATNMISVGIDIERMGLMAIAGQPKTMSEYLQASGRIGRRKDVPGAVFTLFNPYKPRDLSHYEGFVGDHLKLQQSVEPAGITPFSGPAVDRAIHAVMISMIRLTIPSMSGNCDAENLEQNTGEIDAIKGAILDRYASVEDEDANGEKYGQFRAKLDRFVDNWRQYISKAHQMSDSVCYEDDSAHARFGNVKKKDHVLMRDFAAGGRPGQPFPWPTPGSFRDVEAAAGLFYGRAMEGAG